MKMKQVQKETLLKLAANLLYVACDFLRKGEGEEEWINKIHHIATQIDGTKQMKTKPKEEYTKEEIIASIKAYRRLSSDNSSKRELNKMIRAIEAEEELRWIHERYLEDIVDFLPKYEYRKNEKKDFYKKAFTIWFKEHSK